MCVLRYPSHMSPRKCKLRTRREEVSKLFEKVRPPHRHLPDASACSKHCTASVLGAHATASVGMMPFPLMSSP